MYYIKLQAIRIDNALENKNKTPSIFIKSDLCASITLTMFS